jgi:hypothetical protein
MRHQHRTPLEVELELDLEVELELDLELDVEVEVELDLDPTYTALKYFASGWWNTIAAVDSSGTSAPALVRSMCSRSRAGSSR